MTDLPIGDPRPAGEWGPAGDQRAAGEDAPAGDPRPAGEATVTPSFDPTEHTVDEVKAYLDEANEDEATRIVEAEKDGKGRKSIVGE
jgi:trigger factor